jgi:two-component system LytT family sensor kinase
VSDAGKVAVDRHTIVRFSALAAIFWPLAGAVVLTCDAVMAAALRMTPMTGGDVLWRMVWWLVWAAMGPPVVAVALILGPRYRGAKLIAANVGMIVATSLVRSAIYFSIRTLITGRPGEPGESVLDAWIRGLPVTLELDVLVYALTVLCVHALLALRSMEEQQQATAELHQLLASAELELVKMQMPDRLVMTMFTQIETLVVTSVERAEMLINQLSRLLRSALAITVARKALIDEVTLARLFASAATSIRTSIGARPFLIDVRIRDETSSALPATKLMLPILVSIWSDTADDESPNIVIDTAGAGGITCVTWNLTGVRNTTRLRSFAETVRVRLPATESISLRPAAGGLTIAYERPAETSEEITTSRSAEREDLQAIANRRKSAIVMLLAFLTLYPPAEALIAGLISFAIAALTGGPVSDSVFFKMSTAAVATPAGLALAWISFQQRSRPHRTTLFLAIVAAALIGPLLCMTIASAAIALFQAKPFIDVLHGPIAASYQSDDFLIFFGIAIAALAYGRQISSEERRLGNRELDKQLARAHAQALKDQLNPHFVFNALNSILALTDRDGEAAGAMTAKLHQYFELVVGMAERQQVPLHEELRFTEIYLDIEKVRFGERLNVSVDVEPAALTGLVPNLLLQPLIENAVRHGLAPMQGGSVFITAARRRDDLLISVRDDGPGLCGPPRQEGIGMQNVRDRLRQLHGPAFSMDADSSRNGFSVTIRLPFHSEAPV